jgi:hypothetical protein
MENKERGSITEADRSGQSYIPGAKEGQKPPYKVLSPRSTRSQVLQIMENSKTDAFEASMIFNEVSISDSPAQQPPPLFEKFKNFVTAAFARPKE